MNTVTSKDGTTIAFDQTGHGSAIILVGGALQYRAADPRTAQLAELLAAHFTLIHYDRRGRGDSSDTAPYAVEREIEDLAALISEVGESACVFGMSSGAVLALDAAKNLSTKIKKLALYEPPFVVDDSRPPLPTEYVQHLTELIAAGQRGEAVAYFMTKAAGVPVEFVAYMRNEPFWPAFEAVAHTIPYDGMIMGKTMSGHPLPTQRWANVTLPTLVMDGGASPVYQRNGVQALVASLPNAKYCTLDGQDHGVAPEVLAPVLLEFFAG